MDLEYWTYIVASLTGTLYTGVTNSIERRMREAQERRIRGLREQVSVQPTGVLRRIRRNSQGY
jgi:predicted GIY-YIG superfamily endonuclease